jgi:hypothetical protein
VDHIVFTINNKDQGSGIVFHTCKFSLGGRNRRIKVQDLGKSVSLYLTKKETNKKPPKAKGLGTWFKWYSACPGFNP